MSKNSKTEQKNGQNHENNNIKALIQFCIILFQTGICSKNRNFTPNFIHFSQKYTKLNMVQIQKQLCIGAGLHTCHKVDNS